MSRAPDQAYLHTRISLMASRLLGAGELWALLPLGLPELAERLGLTPLLDEQVETRAKSRAVEQALVTRLLADLAILLRPLSPEGRALLMAWASKFALYNLKALVRGKLFDLDAKEIRENLYDLPDSFRLSHPALFRAENLLELLRQLEQGPHASLARQAREAYEQHRDPFALEAAIDRRYYAGLVRQVMGIRGADLATLRHLLGTLLDQVDLLWLLRFRFAYGLSPSETFYQLVPSTRLLYRERLLALVDLEGFEAVLGALPPPLDRRLAESRDLLEVQRRLNHYVSEETRRVLAHSTCGVARALAYLILREGGLNGLFALVQGRLLQIPTELLEVACDLADPLCLSAKLSRAA